MGVQQRKDFTNYNLVIYGDPVTKDSEVLKQDAARSTVLKKGTVMAQVAATRKWVPLTDLTATDGTAIARGVYAGDDIAAADIAAGDIANTPILIGGANVTLDSQLVVLENSLTLNSVRGATTVNACRLEDDLARIGIYVESTIDVMNLEN